MLLPSKDSKPKISDFSSRPTQEYIRHFEISMDNIHGGQVEHSFENVFDERGSGVLIEKPLLFHIHIEVASLAQLANDEALISLLDDVIGLNDIRVIEAQEDVDLGAMQLVELWVFEGL
jgi:hypothetical protein